MKKLIFASIVLSTCALYSCQSIFDQPDDGRISYDDVYSADNFISGYLNKAYTFMPTFASSYGESNFFSVYTDEAHDSKVVDNSTALNYYQGKMSSSYNMIDGSLYTNLFKGIRMCNNFLANIDYATNLTIERYRTKWKGEAYTLRAFYYLQLIKRYGPVPIIKEELPDDYDFSKVVRPTFYENVEAIIEDCDSALIQPEFKARCEKDDQNGSMTAATAWAIKSQAILFAASPLWNNGEDHWEEAAKITGDALKYMRDNNFELYDISTNVKAYSNYQRYFLLTPEMNLVPSQDKETIYAGQNRLNIWQQHGLPFIADVVKAGTCPSQELVDSYETIDGKPVLDYSQPYLDDKHLQPNYNPDNTMYNPEKPYENRDLRFYSSIFYNGVQVVPNEGNERVWTYVGGNSGFTTQNSMYSPTGYYLRKYQNYLSKKDANSDGYWRYFRFAEILLNYAEAEFYAHGVTSEALEAINEVRMRAGLPKLSESITPEEFEYRLRNERRVEFAFEEHRYFDLRRWKINTENEGVITGMKIEKNSQDGSYKYNRVVVSERPVTDEKYSMWPIPLDEQTKFHMYGVEYQNPGW